MEDASTVFSFTRRYIGCSIYATGSSKARTRLYRIGISNNLAEILQDFDIYGLMNGEWYEFKKNIAYDAFLIRRKYL